MEINLTNAIKKFYPNPSLEMVYFEAIANSIDAGADKITIDISIQSFKNPETLTIKITDNGEGFNDNNFSNFGRLLEYQDKYHKGLGRLVYLQYFKQVIISSVYDGGKREFIFDENFQRKSHNDTKKTGDVGTQITFDNYKLNSIKTYDYLKPSSLIESIKLHFFPLFYTKKIHNEKLEIKINLNTATPNPDAGFQTESKTLKASDLPDMESVKFPAETLDLFGEMTLFYSIKQEHKKTSVITSICADNRTIPIDVLSEDEVPPGYELFFLLFSNFFDGKTNSTRQKIDIEDAELNAVKKLLEKSLTEILDEQIPQINERNNILFGRVKNQYPHLNGYIDDKALGLAKKDKIIDNAQKKFFLDQKKILEAEHLDDAQYEKALDVSSRVLTEYILYRKKIIERLKNIDLKSSEADIHEIFVPMQEVLHGENKGVDIYKNNIWLLDDKFMSYSTILSDVEMDKLIHKISTKEEIKNKSRPDIAIVFSKDFEDTEGKVEVVIVELKKLGLKLAGREEVLSQLRERAREILKHFPDKISRVWFYGIVDINDKFRVSLKESGFKPIYSEGQVFYRELDIIVDEENDITYPTGMNIISYDALMLDAESRNSTFLNVLINGLKEASMNGHQPMIVTMDSAA